MADPNYDKKKAELDKLNEQRKAEKKKKPVKNKRGKALVKRSEQRKLDVLTRSQVSDEFKPPKWVKSENTEAYMEMCKLCAISQFKDLTKFSRKYGISTTTIYKWLKHNDTKDLVDEIIKTLAVADKADVYKAILSQVPVNANYARLWMERYEDYQPKQPSHGNVIINFNFLDPPQQPDKVAEDADYEEVE